MFSALFGTFSVVLAKILSELLTLQLEFGVPVRPSSFRLTVFFFQFFFLKELNCSVLTIFSLSIYHVSVSNVIFILPDLL